MNQPIFFTKAMQKTADEIASKTTSLQDISVTPAVN